MLADAEDRHDVGVVQLGGSLCFALEALQLLGVVQGLARQHLDRDPPPQGLLLRLVDDAHATATDLPQQDVVAQPLVEAGAQQALARRGAALLVLLELLHRQDGWEQIVNLRGQLGVLLGVLRRRGVLPLTVPFHELRGQHLDGVAILGVCHFRIAGCPRPGCPARRTGCPSTAAARGRSGCWRRIFGCPGSRRPRCC